MYQIKLEMNFKTSKILIITIMGLLSFLSNFGCKNKKATIENIDYAPFTIQKQTMQKKNFNWNFGHSVSYTSTMYTVLYKGQPVTFPSPLEQNTGLPGLWKAYILKDAPQPAILAGSQSMFLITEEKKQIKIRTLSEVSSGFSDLQWLDSENGQPSRNNKLTISDDAEYSCVLEGGQYLLINGSAVFHISDLTLHPFNKHSSLLDGYYASKAVAFSPDKREVVFEASRSVGVTSYEYALIAFDYKKDEAYVVPFNQTDTRMESIWDINPHWLNTFFEWQKTENGSFKLKKRELDKLPPWQGKFSDDGNFFSLKPAKREMTEAILGFVTEYLQIKDLDIVDELKYKSKATYVHFRYRGSKFTIGYFEEQKSAHFSTYLYDEISDESREIVKKVGNAFNKELNKGKYNTFFTTY